MAAHVKVNRHGYLAFRLFWNGRESWEGTRWKDTPKNRAKAEARGTLMTDEMERGDFDYLKWFPEGNRVHEFRPKESITAVKDKPLTVREFYEEWIEKKKPPFVRLSLQRDYQQNFQKNILPFLGNIELISITVDTLENFRIYLVDERGLALKTAATSSTVHLGR
jgi:hypothetical protein